MMRRLVSILFFLSGATGLLYEVVWAKYLSLTFGNTAMAYTVVLATFLGGLAIGNAIWGPRADRAGRRLRLYGALEVGIGLLALASPHLLVLFSELYVAVARQGSVSPMAAVGLRLVLSALVLLLPTVLMGGTLPTLSRFATRSLGQLEGAVSWLYFLNSAGAVLGTLLAGFCLIPVYGLNTTIMIGGVVNIVIGLVCLTLKPKEESLGVQEHPRPQPGPITLTQIRMTYGAVFLSGCVSLAFEIAWIRLLSLVLGSSTYSFSIMLAAFISGIALGSWLITRRILPGVSSYLLLGLAELSIGLSIVLTLPVYERLPYYFLKISWLLNRTPTTFYIFEGIKFLFCFGLMLLPTTFIGMTLPLASRIVTQSAAEVGKGVGSIFSVNTVGNVLGAVVAGLVLLPLLGIQTLIGAGIAANLFIGFVILVTASQWSRKTRLAAIAGVLAIAAVFRLNSGAWDKRVMSSGEFRTREAPEYADYEEYKSLFEAEDLLYYKDDSNMTVTVVRNKADDDLLLKVNGKVDATKEGDLPTQILLAQLPMCLKPEAREVLVVGLGSGITAGSVLRHPVERLDMVEISGAVVEAEWFFRPYNYSALLDPRLHLHVDDAKTILKVTRRRYDVIISEPSNPWIAGIGNLFSIEFYEEALAHLKEDGLIVQWFHTYEANDDILKLILRTFTSVFRHVTLWEVGPDILVLGSRKPLSVNSARTEAVFNKEEIRSDLKRIGIQYLSTLFSLHAASDSTVRQMAGKGELNSDFLPRLEYHAPKAFYLDMASDLVDRHDERWLPKKEGAVMLSQYLSERDRPLSRAELKDMAEFHAKSESVIAPGLLTEWTKRFPEDPEALWALAQAQRNEAKLESAGLTMARLLEINSEQPEYLEAAADIEYELYWENQTYLTNTRPEKALTYYRRLVDLRTDSMARVQLKLAAVYEVVREYERALDTLEDAAGNAVMAGQKDVTLDEIWLAAAKVAGKMGDPALALTYAGKAVEHNPENKAAAQMLDELSGVP